MWILQVIRKENESGDCKCHSMQYRKGGILFDVQKKRDSPERIQPTVERILTPSNKHLGYILACSSPRKKLNTNESKGEV